VRKAIGFVFFVIGGLLLSFAGERYASGMLQRDRAREAWDEARARAAVTMAQTMVHRHGGRVTFAAGAPIARIVIPQIGLDEIVLEGVDADVLNAGPGHLPGTALPGERGNSVISAHRDRHFDQLGAVEVGDTIRTESGRYENAWVVVGKRVVDRDARVLFASREAILTLTTCWPIRYVGPAPERLIVTARPVSPRLPSSQAIASAN
jgi:LPXTG-site transpeptidase (sortase) family protein